MDHLSNVLCANLSLGEQQRVAIARMLASKPNVILADEPTSSLDDINTNIIIDALLKVSESKTLITVSHDQRITGRFEKVFNLKDIITS